MSCNKLENNYSIDVDITNLILTPLTCATLVSKIIKCLIYEKSQIPYPYEWLKTLINKKRKSENEDDDEKQKNYQAERHYRIVSNAYDTVELLLKEMKNHFRDGNKIEEVLLLFGGSELSPKEVYRIRIPNLAFGHVESYHVTVTDKLSHTVLRKIFLCQEWMDAIDHNLLPTNMFVFFKTNGDSLENSEFFIPNSSFYFPKKTLIVDITLNFNAQKIITDCCSNIKIFQDEYKDRLLNNEKELVKQPRDNKNENFKTEWYQANVTFKGFKEGFINQVPLSQLW